MHSDQINGLVFDFLKNTVKSICALFILFFLILFLGNSLITCFVSNSYRAHIWHDILFFSDTVLCFSVYIYLIISYFFEKATYVSYLTDSIHFMKGGNFRQPIELKGDDELTHLAFHLEELRKIVGKNIEDANLKNETEQQLLTSVSHDLRTPLTTLTGYLEILLDDDFKDAEKRHQYLTLCLERTKQLEDLTSKAFEHFYVSTKERRQIELMRCNSYGTLKKLLQDRSNDLLTAPTGKPVGF